MLYTYAADLVVLSFAGIVIREFADGTFVNVRQDSDDWVKYVGTDGTVSRARTNDRTATVEILLPQTSLHNDQLSTIRNLDINTPNGAGVGAFLLRDLSGRMIVKGAQTWISKPPDIELGREVGTRTWTFHVAKLDRTDGGN